MPTADEMRPGRSRLYDINGKQVCVYWYPDFSFTPEALAMPIIREKRT